MSDSWSATETSPHDPKYYSIREFPEHQGKTIEARRFESFAASPLLSAEVMSKIDWKASIKAEPLNEMQAAEEKWRKYFGLK